MRKSQRGFSLIELLIVVAIILVIAAIAIPNLMRSKIAANEGSAVGSVRTINTAEVSYSTTWGTGYAGVLDNLGGPAGCVAAAATACLIDENLSTAPYTKSGFTFAAVGTLPDAIGLNNGYEVNATPVAVGTTGQRAFCSDESGVIQFVSPGAAPIGTAAGSCAGVAAVAGASGPLGN